MVPNVAFDWRLDILRQMQGGKGGRVSRSKAKLLNEAQEKAFSTTLV